MKYKIGDFIEVEELEKSRLTEDNQDIIIDSSLYKGKELKYYQQNLQGKIVKNPVLGDIHLGQKGRKETGFRSNSKYLAVICFIDKIIETGYSNGQPEDPDHERSKGTISAFYRVYNEVVFDGKALGITVIIAEDNKGKKYYMFRAYTQNESLMSKLTGVPLKEELCRLHQAIYIINQKLENVNPFNENRIYYHGSNYKFTTFDKSKIKENKLGLCFNFTDDYNMAYQYGDNILKVHLDLNNPITQEEFKKPWTYEQDEMLAKKLGFPALDKKDFEEETFGEVYEIFKMDPRFIELLEEMGYDGISFPEDHHFGVFEPEQIHVIQNEQLAYHGSREKFDKFDLNKFQRGDYGYGIYFTRSKGYAGDYGDVKQYEIPDNEYLLSWEDTWQYQSEYVYDCLDKLFDDLYDNNREAWEKIINIVDRGYGNDGEGLYMNLSEILNLTPKQTSELLYKYGIKGIDSFKGNCQVIFNPEDVKMLVTEELNNKYIVYHGSQSNNLILEEKPIYLVTDKEEAIEWAKGYAFNYDLLKEDKPTLYTIEVTLNNPKILQTEDDYYDYMEMTSQEWFIPKLTKDGYDGCIYENYYMPLNAKKQCKIIDKQEFPNNRVYLESFKSLNEKLEKYL